MSERKWYIAGDILVPVRSSEDHGRSLCSYMVVVSVVPFATVFEDEDGTLRVNEQELDRSKWKVIGIAIGSLIDRCDAVYSNFLSLKGVVKPAQPVQPVEKVDIKEPKKGWFICNGRFRPNRHSDIAKKVAGDDEIQFNESWTIYICAKNKADAARLLAQAYGHSEVISSDKTEIREYFSHGCWGVMMDGIKPERGAWASRHTDRKAVRII